MVDFGETWFRSSPGKKTVNNLIFNQVVNINSLKCHISRCFNSWPITDLMTREKIILFYHKAVCRTPKYVNVEKSVSREITRPIYTWLKESGYEGCVILRCLNSIDVEKMHLSGSILYSISQDISVGYRRGVGREEPLYICWDKSFTVADIMRGCLIHDMNWYSGSYFWK